MTEHHEDATVDFSGPLDNGRPLVDLLTEARTMFPNQPPTIVLWLGKDGQMHVTLFEPGYDAHSPVNAGIILDDKLTALGHAGAHALAELRRRKASD